MENSNDKRQEQNTEKEKHGSLTGNNRELSKGYDKKKPDGPLPEDDPALINPDELATFPKEMKNEDPDIDQERDSHSVSRKSSPIREGRNITRTDTTPDNDGGFM